MHESVAKPTKPVFGFWRKTGIVFLLSLLVSTSYYFVLKNPGWPQGSSHWSFAIASILGATGFYFLVAMIFAAWIKGIAGAVVGSLIVAILSYVSFIGEYQHHRSEQEFIGSLQKDQQAVKDSLNKSNNQFGGGTIDLKTIDSGITDLKEKSKNLDPQEKAVAEAAAVVMEKLMEPTRASRSLAEELFSEEFQDFGSIRTVAEIDERLNKIEAFRTVSGKVLSICQNLDVMLKTELAHRNLSATYINESTNSFIKSARMEITLPLAEVSLEIGDIFNRRFTLLKQEFGHWKVKNKIVYFEHSKALEQWNNDVREFFKVAEKREKLTQELVGTQ